MIEAEMVVRIPKVWVTELPRRHAVSVRILNRRSAGKAGVRDLVEIAGTQEELEGALADLKAEPWVKRFDLDFVKPEKLVGEVVTFKCLACAMLAGSDSHLLSAQASRDGTVLWHVMSSDRKDVQKLVARLKKARFEVDIARLAPIDERTPLTRRQEEVIMMAFERGYFETPRKVKLKDLSKLTGVSQATLSEILRKGQKKIVVDYLRSRQRAV
jgi:predicted DNA binding protein